MLSDSGSLGAPSLGAPSLGAPSLGAGLSGARLLEALADDQARLRQLAETADPGATVPSCLDWTFNDLIRHVAAVYLHKVECMRLGREPDQWPPAELADEPTLPQLDRAYAALRAELDTRDPASPAGNWYAPDPTVGFWIRRMAHEALIHRVDAEQAAGQPVGEIADDLAVDGIDEVLRIFLEYGSREWHEYFTGVLPNSPVAVRLVAGSATWLVRLAPEGVEVGSPAAAPTSGAAGELAGAAEAATVTAGPAELLCWLWRRVGSDAVTVTGDPAAVDQLRAALEVATQ